MEVLRSEVSSLPDERTSDVLGIRSRTNHVNLLSIRGNVHV